MEEKSITIFQRVKALTVRNTVKSARSRTDKLREELAEAESVEQLFESMFVEYNDLLEEVDKATQSMNRATTKIRKTVKDRKAQLAALLEE